MPAANPNKPLPPIEKMAIEHTTRIFQAKIATRKVRRDSWRQRQAENNSKACYGGFMAEAETILALARSRADFSLADLEEMFRLPEK